MASNYEQPKLATSKQYNVSPGNIGQVKQQNVDWTDYESAKIWEAVAKGTGQVGQAIQVDAKLRGALDQTGNLVANNSWLTQESYDQGRASVVAEQQKGTFLEKAKELSSQIARANGTMDDYNKAIEPYYQEYIKNIRTAPMVDVNGNPTSVELQKETLANARKEMITYVALGQQQFQKIKEQQNEIDRQDLNANIGNNLLYAIKESAKVGDIPTLMATSRQKAMLMNSQLGDPVKARAETDAIDQAALTQVFDVLDPNNQLDVAKADTILKVLDDPDYNLNVTSKDKVRAAYTKFKEKHNSVVNYNLSSTVSNLATLLEGGTYNPKDYAATRSAIEQAAQQGKISWSEADGLQRRLQSLNGQVADAAKNSPNRLYELNQAQALGEFKGDLSKHAAKVYESIAKEIGDKGGSTADVNEAFYKWATSGGRTGVSDYTNYLATQLSKNVASGLPLDLSVTPELEKRISSPDMQDITQAQWPQMVAIAAGNSNFTHAVSDGLPKDYKQAFIQLSVEGKLGKGYLNDIKMLADTAKFNKEQINSGEVTPITAEHLKPSMLVGGIMDGTSNYQLRYLNSATEGTLNTYGAKLTSMVKTDPTVKAAIASAGGILNWAEATGVKEGAIKANLLTVTGNGEYMILSEKPGTNFMKTMQTGTGATKEEVGDATTQLLNRKLRDEPGDKSWFKDRNYLTTFDAAGLNLTVQPLDDNGNKLLGQQAINIPVATLKKAVTDQVSIRPKAVAPLKVAAKGMNGLTIDTSRLESDSLIGNASLTKEWIETNIAHESVIKSPRATDKNRPDVVTVGAGVSSVNKEAFNLVKTGYETGNMAAVNKGHTMVLEAMAQEIKPTLRTSVGGNPKDYDQRQMSKAMVILAATYQGGAGTGRAVAKLMDDAGKDGNMSSAKFFKILEANRGSLTKELKSNYNQNAPLTDRGLWYMSKLRDVFGK